MNVNGIARSVSSSNEYIVEKAYNYPQAAIREKKRYINAF